MHALNELLHTPVPSGTPGRAVAGVSERTRSGAGVEAGENAKSDCERNEPSPTPAPHDAIKRHGFPLPLEAIYAANTISRADFDRLTKGKRCSKHVGRIEAPAYIERMASSEDRVFIAPCEEWARRAASGEAGWAWVKSAPVERGRAWRQGRTPESARLALPPRPALRPRFERSRYLRLGRYTDSRPSDCPARRS